MIMKNEFFFFLSGGLTLLWGVSHLFPTRAVVRNFGDISADNRRIIKMEWITEGIALIFIGMLAILVALLGDPHSATGTVTYLCASGCLIVMAIVSFFTGSRVNFLPYKLCPVIFGLSALLMILGITI
jgi:hypothetical protein